MKPEPDDLAEALPAELIEAAAVILLIALEESESKTEPKKEGAP